MKHESPAKQDWRVCLVCLAKKNMHAKERYPYSSEALIRRPIEPLLELDVQPDKAPKGSPSGLWRRIAVCHECFHKLAPDMWISENCLRKVGCKTPFTDLPLLEDEDK